MSQMSMDMSQDDNPESYNPDAPEEMEDIHQMIRMFGVRLTLKMFDDALNNPAFNPVLKRWMTRQSNGTRRGNLGPKEWDRYTKWLALKGQGEDFDALTPLKEQMKEEAKKSSQAVSYDE